MILISIFFKIFHKGEMCVVWTKVLSFVEQGCWFEVLQRNKRKKYF